MSSSVERHLKPQFKIFNPKNERELGLFLMEIYPDGKIPCEEFHRDTLNGCRSSIATIKSNLGVGVDFYDVGMMASFLWFKGNYNESERSFTSEYE